MNAISGISLAKNLLARIYVANPQHAETSIILPQKWHSTVLFPESDYSYHLGCITVEKHTAYGIIKWALVNHQCRFVHIVLLGHSASCVSYPMKHAS
jgi:hypothetical protein